MVIYGDKTRYFDEHAADFEADFSAEEKHKLAWMMQQWDIGSGMTVLEPGCGAGALTGLLLTLVGPTGRIIALDVSEEMLRRARERIGGLIPLLRNAVEFHETDLERYEPTDSSVDVAICCRFLPHMENIPAGLAVINRALKSGGRLFIEHLASRERVNQIHSETGGPIAHDAIPPEAELRAMLARSDFEVRHYSDGPDLYHVEATKKGP